MRRLANLSIFTVFVGVFTEASAGAMKDSPVLMQRMKRDADQWEMELRRAFAERLTSAVAYLVRLAQL